VVDVRRPDYVSLTSDKTGHVIMTWMGAEWKDYLYYTLLGENGAVITPPMAFAKAKGVDPLIQTSFTGQGIAPYDGSWRIFMPVMSRPHP
jgi:hypothetical protein